MPETSNAQGPYQYHLPEDLASRCTAVYGGAKAGNQYTNVLDLVGSLETANKGLREFHDTEGIEFYTGQLKKAANLIELLTSKPDFDIDDDSHIKSLGHAVQAFSGINQSGNNLQFEHLKSLDEAGQFSFLELAEISKGYNSDNKPEIDADYVEIFKALREAGHVSESQRYSEVTNPTEGFKTFNFMESNGDKIRAIQTLVRSDNPLFADIASKLVRDQLLVNLPRADDQVPEITDPASPAGSAPAAEHGSAISV